ncbi:MAG: PfkB family carbohydrate kinase [Blautia faecis]
MPGGLAGAELNFSIGVTRLGHTASYFTKLGKDPYGAYIHEFIEKEKIDGEKVLFTEEYLTGSYLKTKVLEGDPAAYYFRKNSAAFSCICPKDIEAQDLSGVKMVHITGITPALSEDCRRSCMTLAKEPMKSGRW